MILQWTDTIKALFKDISSPSYEESHLALSQLCSLYNDDFSLGCGLFPLKMDAPAQKFEKSFTESTDCEAKYYHDLRYDIVHRTVNILVEKVKKELNKRNILYADVKLLPVIYQDKRGFKALAQYNDIATKETSQLSDLLIDRNVDVIWGAPKPLTFADLRKQNSARSKECYPQCQDWSGSDWMTALVGELGEAANLIKKHKRDDNIGPKKFKEELSKEFADIQMYLDHIAEYYNINLEEAVINKFNEVSEKIGSNRRL